jgi:PD-(D/E)XK nuclease superfamily protein
MTLVCEMNREIDAEWKGRKIMQLKEPGSIKPPILKHDNKSVGERSEVAISARFIELGYYVARPIGDSHRYDLIVEDANENLYRVQCKTGRIKQGCVFFKALSSYAHHRKGGSRNYRGQIDYFAVYAPTIKKFYLVPVDLVGTTEGILRLEPTKNNQEKFVRWAKDYEL